MDAEVAERIEVDQTEPVDRDARWTEQTQQLARHPEEAKDEAGEALMGNHRYEYNYGDYQFGPDQDSDTPLAPQNLTFTERVKSTAQQLVSCSWTNRQIILLLSSIVGVHIVIAALNHTVLQRPPVPSRQAFWQTTTVYSIHVKSFQDGSKEADGIGDLRGIITRLDYLVYLGVGVICLSPIYPTGNDEPLFGYDVVNFVGIDPVYGNLEDLKELTRAAKSKGIKVILDFVPNHSSIRHKWFEESFRNRSSQYGNYYVWRDGAKGGGPPNNWVNLLGSSAWTWHPERNQYYYHVYSSDQPDLNFRNPDVRNDMKSILRFWLSHGIAGFRLLSVPYLLEAENTALKEPEVKGASVGRYDSLQHIYTRNVVDTYGLVGEFRSLLNEVEMAGGASRVLMVVTDSSSSKELGRYHGSEAKPVADLIVNSVLTANVANEFTGIQLQYTIVSHLKSSVDWNQPTWLLGNADHERVASRLGAGIIDGMAILQHLLPGTPIIYYGEELGMEDVNVYVGSLQSTPEQCSRQDMWDVLSHPCNQARSPFQWDSTNNTAGFTKKTEPWFPIGGDAEYVNVEKQALNPNSHLSIYRQLIRLRKEPAFVYGNFSLAETVISETIFAFTRSRKGVADYMVLINLGENEETVDFTKEKNITPEAQVVLRSSPPADGSFAKGTKIDTTMITVGPKEGIVLSMAAAPPPNIEETDNTALLSQLCLKSLTCTH